MRIVDSILAELDQEAVTTKRVLERVPQDKLDWIPADELEQLLRQVLSDNSLAIDSLKCIATSDVKHDEAGLNELAESLELPVRFYSADDLNSRPGPSGPSAASKHLGVVGVSEPAALLASGCNNLIVAKTKSERATVAIARIGSAS